MYLSLKRMLLSRACEINILEIICLCRCLKDKKTTPIDKYDNNKVEEKEPGRDPKELTLAWLMILLHVSELPPTGAL